MPALARAGTGLINVAPSRSKTDPPLDKQKSDRAHFHKRLHASTITGRNIHLHSQGHRHRDRGRDTPQSAVDVKPPTSFDHLLRRDRDKKTPETSRQGSELAQEVEQWRAAQAAQVEKDARARVKPEDVEKARADNERREEELREALKDVEEVGMQSTRQLDDTYYAILEKASLLRSTVASLQHLAEENRKVHKQFEEDTQTLERETRETVDGFQDFDQQEKAINGLVEKLKNSKAETEKLNARLENARQRVAAFEQRENEVRSTRRKQWNATWGTLVGVLVLVVVVILLKNRWSGAWRMDEVGKTLTDVGGSVGRPKELLSKLRPSPSEDPYLRKLFDEL